MRAAHPLYGAIYALLTTNTLWYLVVGPWAQALDSLAWLVLLMLFALETRQPNWLEKKQLRSAVDALVYTRQNEWLDFINIALWILVVALIECELRLPQRVAHNRCLFTGVAVALYSAIALLIPLWALRGEWFDAYDAVLWLIAFALIERDALKLAL